MPTIPSRYVMEFINNPRLKGPHPPGTKPADIAVMKQVIAETLSDPKYLQQLVQYAMKNAEIRLK
jgi:hypothetical protein